MQHTRPQTPLIMQDSRLIAASSAALRRLLAHEIAARDSVLEHVHVTALSPEEIELTVTRPTLNVMLYEVRHDANVKNASAAAAGLSRREPGATALAFRVLLTAYGPVHDDAGDIAHRLLGAAMQVLDARPILEPEHLHTLPPLHANLPGTPLLRIAPVAMTLDDMSRLWAMLRASYRLSLVYDVLLVPDGEPGSGAPGSVAHERDLPERQSSTTSGSVLREMTEHARLGRNAVALFVAADVGEARRAAHELAKSLDRELLELELGAVPDRYIGETEKNLAARFARAAESAAVLFFDEADALFGKRTTVRDSHDRYANIEVSYLLQAIEAHPGVVILYSNSKSALDPAFLRRLRFVVDLA